VLWELNIAMIVHFEQQLLSEKAQSRSYSVNPEESLKRQQLIYESGEDELTERVDAALTNLEEKVRKYIR
jgi:hypothetical protein